MVFVNDVPQVPGKGYTFPGGSTLTFTEAPKVGDSIEILFYKGTGSQDVVERRVLETVKPGDDLQIGHLESQDFWLEEAVRVPISVDSTDRVSTPPYYGPGNTADPLLERPIKWTRQTEDKIINQTRIWTEALMRALKKCSPYNLSNTEDELRNKFVLKYDLQQLICGINESCDQ